MWLHVQKAAWRARLFNQGLKDENFAFKLNTLICIFKISNFEKSYFFVKVRITEVKMYMVKRFNLSNDVNQTTGDRKLPNIAQRCEK